MTDLGDEYVYERNIAPTFDQLTSLAAHVRGKNRIESLRYIQRLNRNWNQE